MSDKNTKFDAEKLAKFCAAIAEEKLAEDVLTLFVAPQTTVADYFVIATVNSEPQLRALGGHLEHQVRDEFKLRNMNHDRAETSGWMLIDFGCVLIHVMTREMRERYSLESLWGKAEEVRAHRA